MAKAYDCVYKGKGAKIYPHRVTLTDTTWLELELPAHDPRWTYWRIRNLDDTNGLDISFERKVPDNNPDYFTIDPRGPEGVLDDDALFPSYVWVRKTAGGNQVFYYECIVLKSDGDKEVD
jgi:hypothetical protein